MGTKVSTQREIRKRQPVELAMSHEHLKYRADIDGLRAIAILSVVIFHAFPALLTGGFVGVDIFFVISGFLISSIIFKGLQGNTFSFIDFYARRAKRIFPALIVVLAASYIFGWFALLPDEFKQLGKHIAAGTVFFQNFSLLGESGYFDTASELKPMMHLWSLAIEEQFYIIYPLMMWAAWRCGFSLIGSITLLTLASFGLNVYRIEANPIGTFFSPQTRFWELLVGAILAYINVLRNGASFLDRFSGASANKDGAHLSNFLSVSGIAFIVVAIIYLDSEKRFPGWWALLPVVGAGLLIQAGPDAWINKHVLSNRVMVFFGLISYPLYLWHWPVLSFARIVESGAPSAIVQGSALLLCVILAMLTYRYVERPLRLGGQSSRKPALLWVALLCVGAVGLTTFMKDGLPFRVHEFAEKNNQFAWGALSNEACRKAYPAFWPIDHCSLTRDGDPTILLVGDSHSDHINFGLSEAVSKTADNLLNLGVSGCTPFYDVGSHPRGVRDWCTTYINKALELALSSESIETVVLASRGPMYITGNGYKEGEDHVHHDRVLDYVGHAELSNYSAVFEAGMRNTLTILAKAKKKVVFILDVPELGFSPKACVNIRPLRRNYKVMEPCAISRAEVDSRNKEYRSVVTKVLKDFPSVSLFDSQAKFCDADWCWAMVGGKVMYRDDDHLSEQGSKYLAKTLLPVILSTQLSAGTDKLTNQANR